MLDYIRKRDGRLAPFEKEKIREGFYEALKSARIRHTAIQRADPTN